jgi:hypothetical protein
MKRIKSFKIFESEINESDIDITLIESECNDILVGLRDFGFITNIKSKHYNYYLPYWEITITIKNVTNSFPVYTTKQWEECCPVFEHLESYLDEEDFYKSSESSGKFPKEISGAPEQVHTIIFKSHTN